MLWDPIRSTWVPSTPEEEVRQKWIQVMTTSLEYPRGLLLIEKDLALLPFGETAKGLNRRLDLLCMTPGKEGLIPLLLMEFKEGKLNGAERQVFGYNEIVKAPFIAIANGKEIKTLWREQTTICSISFLPSYPQLVEKVCSI